MTKDDYVALLHWLPCVVCYLRFTRERWLATVGKVQAHHLESVRHSYSDWGTVPACRDHHDELHVHIGGGSRRAFERKYKLDDVKLLEGTIKLMLFFMENCDYGRVGKTMAGGAEAVAVFRRLQ